MRRLLSEQIKVGINALDEQQSHHARSVLRLTVGETVELFDRAGRSAEGVIDAIEPQVSVRVESIRPAAGLRTLVIASAVPKGDRADWMVEKMSEIGVTRWIPLRTERSVVHPEGVSKFDRWRRIADESAKQCKRPGVMEIAELLSLDALLRSIEPGAGLLLSTAGSPRPIHTTLDIRHSIFLIGPEGGWSEKEEKSMLDRGLTPVTLGPTIPRIETAAVVAAGIVAACSFAP